MPTIKVSRYVYVVASAVGVTKVGITDNLKRRLGSIQTDSPVPIRLFNSIRLPHRLAREVEALCHKELAEFHSHREWFKVEPTVAWECVQRHGNAVMNEHIETRRREEWLIDQLKALEVE